MTNILCYQNYTFPSFHDLYYDIPRSFFEYVAILLAGKEDSWYPEAYFFYRPLQAPTHLHISDIIVISEKKEMISEFEDNLKIFLKTALQICPSLSHFVRHFSMVEVFLINLKYIIYSIMYI